MNFASSILMARSKVAQVSEFPYHITSRIINRLEFPVSIRNVWTIFSDELYWLNKKYGLEIYSFVLMPNHFHLLARTLETPIGKILNELLANTSKCMNEASNKINQNWGGRSYKTQISNLNYYFNVYRYIYQNPLRAGLVDRVENYPFSTLHGLLGKSRILIPIVDDQTLFNSDIEKTLLWLNESQNKKDLELIRKALKYKNFRPPKDRISRKSLLEFEAPPLQK